MSPGIDQSAEQFERATYSKITWRLMPYLFLCYILAYVDRVNVGFAKLQMQQDLRMSDSVFGVGAVRSGFPAPLSETVNFQSVSDTL